LRREIERAARPESLQEIRDFLAEACRETRLGRRAARDLVGAVDEACTNVVVHGYAGRDPGRLGVAFEADEDRVRVTISDRGRAFDPKDAPPARLDADWGTRPVGGLGWHLIRKFVDEIAYESDPETGNRLTLVKKVEGGRE
jgi:serine/threonine-protein kinase RsbW